MYFIRGWTGSEYVYWCEDVGWNRNICYAILYEYSNAGYLTKVNEDVVDYWYVIRLGE